MPWVINSKILNQAQLQLVPTITYLLHLKEDTKAPWLSLNRAPWPIGRRGTLVRPQVRLISLVSAVRLSCALKALTIVNVLCQNDRNYCVDVVCHVQYAVPE